MSMQKDDIAFYGLSSLDRFRTCCSIIERFAPSHGTHIIFPSIMQRYMASHNYGNRWVSSIYPCLKPCRPIRVTIASRTCAIHRGKRHTIDIISNFARSRLACINQLGSACFVRIRAIIALHDPCIIRTSTVMICIDNGNVFIRQFFEKKFYLIHDFFGLIGWCIATFGSSFTSHHITIQTNKFHLVGDARQAKHNTAS